MALLSVLLAAHTASPEMPVGATASLKSSAMPMRVLQLLAAQNVGMHEGPAGRCELRGGRGSSDQGSAEEEGDEVKEEEEEEEEMFKQGGSDESEGSFVPFVCSKRGLGAVEKVERTKEEIAYTQALRIGNRGLSHDELIARLPALPEHLANASLRSKIAEDLLGAGFEPGDVDHALGGVQELSAVLRVPGELKEFTNDWLERDNSTDAEGGGHVDPDRLAEAVRGFGRSLMSQGRLNLQDGYVGADAEEEKEEEEEVDEFAGRPRARMWGEEYIPVTLPELSQVIPLSISDGNRGSVIACGWGRVAWALISQNVFID